MFAFLPWNKMQFAALCIASFVKVAESSSSLLVFAQRDRHEYVGGRPDLALKELHVARQLKSEMKSFPGTESRFSVLE